MKVTRILVVALLLAVVASAAYADNCLLVWNACSSLTYPSNQNWNGPTGGPALGLYKLVVAGTNVAPGGVYYGTDTRIAIDTGLGGGPLPDAWRFDSDGCNVGQVTYATNAFSKSCIAFGNIAPLGIQNFSMLPGPEDPSYEEAGMTLANAFSDFTTVAASTQFYTLYQVSFNHAYSDVGPQDPAVACGNVQQPINFVIWRTEFALVNGNRNIDGGLQDPKHIAFWQGGVPYDYLGAKAATWGRVKGLYR